MKFQTTALSVLCVPVLGAVLMSESEADTNITVTKARIGCLDIQHDGNLTPIVGRACNGRMDCSFKAPTEDQYKREGVRAATRPFCTQGMEIAYRCGSGGEEIVNVPGDAWNHPPAHLHCEAPPPVVSPHDPNAINIVSARIGCLDIQKSGNLTSMVARDCNARTTCSFKAPTEAQYKAAGVQAATRAFCTQGMEIAYRCGSGGEEFVNVPGDAWNHPPAQLHCDAPPPVVSPNDPNAINIVSARIGCLDIQKSGNLTSMVARDCNARKMCSFKAPTEAQYKAAGVQAATRTFCTQAMEITYRCGSFDPDTVHVDGDAWNHPPAQLACGTVATDEQTLNNLADEPCEKDWPGKYFVTPADMLDWTPHDADTFPIENHAPPPATRDMWNTTGSRVGSPGSTIGANEGRLVPHLRMIAQRKDPPFALCESAKAFAGNAAGNPPRPTGVEWGKAMADLAVTGRVEFERFAANPPSLASLKGACPGVPDADLTRALDRAYAIANAVRVKGPGGQPSSERLALGWAAVSGEDDKPLRPVNVPTAPFPQFNVMVDTTGLAGPYHQVNTRYMIAHARPPAFRFGPAKGTAPHQLTGDILPEFAPDAQVILFIHGMDSRVEEALNLTNALHTLAREPLGRNWTVVSVDLPSSGYTDSLDHEQAFGSADAIGCHHTPQVDFLEDFIVRFVDAVDRSAGGNFKGRIRAIVGGSLGGNMSMRLGRRNFLPDAHREDWIRTVVPWSPAAIWPSLVARSGIMAGCDTGWDGLHDIAVNWPKGMSKIQERVQDRRNLFYGGFDYNPPSQRPQAQYWWRDGWACKESNIVGARVDRHETYDAEFRRWHWRLASEQLAFSQRQNQGPDQTRHELADPLFLYNRTPMLLMSGEKDVGGDLGKWTHATAPLMKNTPGEFLWLGNTGHSLDDERPMFVARQIVNFLSKH
jgi:hypothetical protein